MKTYLNKHKKSILISILLLLIIIGLFLLDILVNDVKDLEKEKSVNPMMKDAYNGYGLPLGVSLSDNILYENDSIICYSDRLVSKLKIEEESIKNIVLASKNLSNLFGPNISFNIVPIPTRIVMEKNGKKWRNTYIDLCTSLREKIIDDVGIIGLNEVLLEHKDEYIYFRTEDSWTARGAYYGTSEILRKKNIKPIPLEEYTEHMYKEMRGAFFLRETNINEKNKNILSFLNKIPSDEIYYYLAKETNNKEVLIREKNGKTEEIRRPIISSSNIGLSIFSGAADDYAILEGDGRSQKYKDKTVILFCDSVGQLMSPYLANYYKNVYAIGIGKYKKSMPNLSEIIKEYDVCDVIWAQSADTMGELALSGALKPFFIE